MEKQAQRYGVTERKSRGNGADCGEAMARESKGEERKAKREELPW